MCGMQANAHPNAEDESADTTLADRVREGDRHAFERIFLDHYQTLCVFAYGYVQSHAMAEDVVADVFAWVWERRYQWEITTSIRAFLYGAVRNRCLNAARDAATAHRALSSAESTETLAPQPLPRPDHPVSHADIAEHVQHAVGMLSERQRAIVQLRWREGLTWKEIGSVLQISPNAAEIEHRRAIGRLRSTLPTFLR